MWLWFQMCKFPTGTVERRLRRTASSFYWIYIDSTVWFILPHTYFSLFYSYPHRSISFWLLCTPISHIDVILNLSFKKTPSWFKCQRIVSQHCFRSCDGNKSLPKPMMIHIYQGWGQFLFFNSIPIPIPLHSIPIPIPLGWKIAIPIPFYQFQFQFQFLFINSFSIPFQSRTKSHRHLSWL